MLIWHFVADGFRNCWFSSIKDYPILNCEGAQGGYTVEEHPKLQGQEFPTLMHLVDYCQEHEIVENPKQKEPKDKLVKFHVSGREFQTYTSTLLSGRGERVPLTDLWIGSKVVCLDRNPEIFAVLLDWYDSSFGCQVCELTDLSLSNVCCLMIDIRT